MINYLHHTHEEKKKKKEVRARSNSDGGGKKIYSSLFISMAMMIAEPDKRKERAVEKPKVRKQPQPSSRGEKKK